VPPAYSPIDPTGHRQSDFAKTFHAKRAEGKMKRAKKSFFDSQPSALPELPRFA
jgi:hypothetical protein